MLTLELTRIGSTSGVIQDSEVEQSSSSKKKVKAM